MVYFCFAMRPYNFKYFNKMNTHFFTISLLSISLLFLFSCQNNSAVIKREGEPDIVRIKGDDGEMNKAIELANKNFGQFDSVFSRNDTTVMALAIKMRFGTTDGGEHIWITDISKKGNHYYGVVGNLPESTKEVSLGDTVKIAKAQISDWMYIQNGKLKGGYTIRALRNQLSDAEKRTFDEENGFSVD